jgi:UDP-N-acetylmuramate--alanine ligase
MVTEACEYKKNLLHMSSDVSIVLNIDKDHMECYQNEDDLVQTFRDFSRKAKTCFVSADDENCKKLSDCATFGIKNSLADYRATDIRVHDERYAFTVEEYGRVVARIRLRAIGYCNVYNALAAFASMRSLGFHETEIAEGIEGFIAVKRRFERIGVYCGASFICDYAHHPREIKAALKTASGICRGNLYVVFQPHTYSRTKLLMADFIDVLRPIKNLMVYKTYPARESYDEMGAARTLSNVIGNSLYAENIHVLKTWLKTTVKNGDAVLFLGAGDIYYIAQHVLKDLGRSS